MNKRANTTLDERRKYIVINQKLIFRNH